MKKEKKYSNEIFEIQKKRIYNALIKLKFRRSIKFDSVLNKIING